MAKVQQSDYSTLLFLLRTSLYRERHNSELRKASLPIDCFTSRKNQNNRDQRIRQALLIFG